MKGACLLVGSGEKADILLGCLGGRLRGTWFPCSYREQLYSPGSPAAKDAISVSKAAMPRCKSDGAARAFGNPNH